MPVIDVDALITNRVDAIRAYHEKCGVEKAQIDVSGGIDSAVMLMLLRLALGPNCVIADHTKIHTSPEATTRAIKLAKAIGVEMAVGEFTKIYELLVNEVFDSLMRSAKWNPSQDDPDQPPSDLRMKEISDRLEKDPTILGSVRSTLRAPLGRAYNRIMGGGIRHGTGNECEDRFLRFYQKGGDGEVDTNPLAMLSKSEVYQLAFALGQTSGRYAPEAVKAIIDAVPSPDLWGNGETAHTDEAELLAWTGAPFTYGRIDSDTGKITYVGTIERVSRFFDSPYWTGECWDVEGGRVHDPIERNFRKVNEEGWRKILSLGLKSPLFAGINSETIEKLLNAARKAERQTRHKLNPNIPTLGTRQELVEAGILINDLPQLAGKKEEES